MKKNLLCLSLLFVGSFAFLSGCNTPNSSSSSSEDISSNTNQSSPSEDTSSKDESSSSSSLKEESSSREESSSGQSSSSEESSSSKTYTQEELFDLWIEGRNYYSSCTGNYDVMQTNMEYDGANLYSRDVTGTGRKENEFYVTNEGYIYPDGNEELVSLELLALKNLVVEGKNRSKLVREAIRGKQTRKEGYYVSPTYYDDSEIDTFKDRLKWFGIDKGDTYQDFVNELTSYYEEEGDIVDNIEFVLENDYIDLDILSHGEYKSRFVEDETYINTTYEAKSTYRVSEGKLTDLVSETKTKDNYTDKVYESRTDNTISIDYAFNQEFFDSISFETEETPNHYYGPVYFKVEGQNLRYSDDAYVYERYEPNDAKTYLASLKYQFIVASDTSIYKDCFDIYLDADYKTPFEGKEVESDDPITLYAKFNLPSDTAFVITVFRNEEKSWIYLAYPKKVGDVYDIDYGFKDKKLASIDGVRYNEGDSKKFTCSENKAYVVIFDTPELAG